MSFFLCLFFKSGLLSRTGFFLPRMPLVICGFSLFRSAGDGQVEEPHGS